MQRKYPEMKELWDNSIIPNLANDVYDSEDYTGFEDKPDATQEPVRQAASSLEPDANLIGGAADLAPSTKTYMADMGDFSKDNYAGRNLHFGVRELAMSAIEMVSCFTAACGHSCPPSL